MKIVNMLTGLTLGLLITTSAVNAETKQDQNIVEKKASTGNGAVFSYRPPMRGAPAARIGGGTRGVGNQTLELVALAPDHTGLTIREQPTLYWYVSEPVQSKLSLTLINDDLIEPVLEQAVATSGSAGIQSIDLTKTKTKLVPGLEYRWFVSVMAGEKQSSNDIVASGTIQRIVPDDNLNREIAGANESTLVDVYAKEGIWYDAIDSLSKISSKNPENSKKYATLLEQVGLQSAADYVRKQVH